MKIAKAEFEAMVLEGTARRGEGSWASPLHLVPKKSEGWRRCGDYRALNARTIPGRCPVRHIHDYSHHLQGCNIFSVIDLVKAYTAVNEEDIPKTRLRRAQPLTWTSEFNTAFSKCKEALSKVTLLTHPAPDVPLGLFTDASACHIEAALMQRVDGSWRPLAFFSKKLATAQSQWPAYYRELFAIYSAVQHFCHVLEAQHFTIYTDHKPITYAFLQRRENLPPVQLNQLSFIGRLQQTSSTSAIVKAQKGDMELLDLQTSDNSLKLKKIEVPGSDVTLVYDTSMPRPRPFVPASERRRVFDSLHGLSHPG
ncbi:uncharacterized protein TNIN_496321 [Trichonephila inaurata madagascariensis]|uniref:Reverse transcriptase/retrotransposon-derived protein RNase H-like domain-containing protein n=1 Tax=Trichonephila inaurata madagascariensis TaxID=2747483 RepID=A0A8X7BUW5_9ARAC|nr:uncharacterized protein TNIN_496321 [Trichonephila inaurata madagascariensis]